MRIRIALALALLCAGGNLHAVSTGISGRSSNPATNSGAFCTGCHTGGGYSIATTISGATTLAPGALNAAYSVSATGLATRFGFNFSATGGTLAAGTGSRLTNTAGPFVDDFSGELTHDAPQAAASWSFTFNAPANVGTISMYACINPVDFTGGFDLDGPANCDSHNVTINRTPTATDDMRTVLEDSAASASSVMSNDFSGTAADDGGDSISITAFSDPPNGSASITGGGTTITYAPDANFSGSDSFTYTITDSLGATDIATVAVTVTAVNDAPVAVDDSVDVDRNSTNNAIPASGTVLTNDTDAENSTLSVTLINGSASATVATTNGSVTRTGNSLSYTPTAGYSGVDSFTYTVSDGSLTDTGTVNVTVNALAIPDAATVNEDSATSTINVLANDVLADSGKTLVSVTAPNQGGTATISGTDPNEVIRYTPAANFSGTETFSYTMTDSTTAQDSALVTVTVTAINDAPVITSIAPSAASDGQAYSYPLAVTDADGTTSFSFDLSGEPAGMTVSSAGLINWTPDCGDGTDAGPVTVTVSDGTTGTDTEIFSIAVTVLDSDSDGMPNCFETAEGFDPDDAADAAQDADGDGSTNLAEYLAGTDPNLDNVPPVVTAPADLVTPATGYLTMVDPGEATAVDGRDGALAVSSDWIAEGVRPGRYTVIWTASDLAGNAATDTQQIDVLPMADFNVDQFSGEGLTVNVGLALNGEPPAYPVTINYTVSGTAGAGDSDAVSGTLTINSPNTAGIIPVQIASDSSTEAAETLIFTITGASNATPGIRSAHTLTIVDANVAPTVTLTAVQGSFPRQTAYQGDGPVTLMAGASDPNGDSLSYDWSGSDDALGLDAQTTASVNTADPSGLPAGAYIVQVAASDPGGASTSVSLVLVVQTGASTASDLDADGIFEPVDTVAEISLLQNQTGNTAATELLETEPGLSLRMGGTARAAGRTGALIAMSDIVLFGVGDGGLVNGADSFDNVGGLFDFEIHGVAPGGTARVVLPLQTSIRQGAVYRKFNPASGWGTFISDSSNAVASAFSSVGVCPGPASDDYAPGLNIFADCVRLTLQDGGPNDADGAVNGVIADPGGVSVTAPASSTPGQAINHVGALLGLWMLLLLALVRRRLHAVSGTFHE